MIETILCPQAAREGYLFEDGIFGVNLEITRNNMTGETKVTGYSYTPIFTVADDQGILKVLRLREGIKSYDSGHVNRVTKETYDKMVYALKRVEERVKE